MRGFNSRPVWSLVCPQAIAVQVLLALAILAVAGSSTALAVGYKNVGSIPADDSPTGIAINHATGEIFAANLISFDAFPGTVSGTIQRFSPDEVEGPHFGEGGFTGVAVDPTDGDVYALDLFSDLFNPLGEGSSRMTPQALSSPPSPSPTNAGSSPVRRSLRTREGTSTTPTCAPIA